MKKIEYYEDYVSQYEEWITVLSERIEEADNKLREIDNKGTFESDDEVGWLGLHLSESPLRISKFLAESPLRNQLQTGDEIIAINGRRTRKSSDLKGALRGNVEQEIKLTISRRGGIMEFYVVPAKDPLHPVIITGNGNKLWKAFSSSRRLLN